MRERRGKTVGDYVTVFLLTLFATLIIGGFLLVFLWLEKQEGNERQKNESAFSQNVIKNTETTEVTNEKNEGVYQQGDDLGESVQFAESTEASLEDDSRYGKILSNTELMETERIHAIDGANTEEVTLIFGGDIGFDDNYSIMSTYHNRGDSIEQGFSKELIAYMREADICMLNNEFPYTTRGEPLPNKAYTFRSRPENVRILNELGVDLVSLANNHASDFGEVSLLDSLKTLKQAGIAYVGAGENFADASHPVYYIVNDIKIAIVAATQVEQLPVPDTKPAGETTPGVLRCYHDDRIYDVLAEAKANSDFVVFFVHWGSESTTELHWAQTDFAPKYIDAGADVIIGAHPHVLQEIDIVNGKPVAYSLGNFWFNSKAKDTGMIELKINKSGLQSFRFVPCIQADCKTSLVNGEEKNRIIQYMNSLSGGKLDAEGYLKNN